MKNKRYCPKCGKRMVFSQYSYDLFCPDCDVRKEKEEEENADAS